MKSELFPYFPMGFHERLYRFMFRHFISLRVSTDLESQCPVSDTLHCTASFRQEGKASRENSCASHMPACLTKTFLCLSLSKRDVFYQLFKIEGSNVAPSIPKSMIECKMVNRNSENY